jgi:hypothetical protein
LLAIKIGRHRVKPHLSKAVFDSSLSQFCREKGVELTIQDLTEHCDFENKDAILELNLGKVKAKDLGEEELGGSPALEPGPEMIQHSAIIPGNSTADGFQSNLDSINIEAIQQPVCLSLSPTKV